MAKLIEELKNQHKTIAETLSKVRELGIGSADGQKMLMTARDGLMAHLVKEDRELYPVLRENAKSDERLRRTMEVFAKDMEAISEAVLKFFTKYANGGSGVEFARDFGRLFVILGGRISKEEDILYKEYEKNVS